MFPGRAEGSEGWGLGWPCTATHNRPPSRLGMRPRPPLTDGRTDGQKTISSYRGTPSLTHSQAPQGSGLAGQSREEAKCALLPGKGSPSQLGALRVFLLAFSVSL